MLWFPTKKWRERERERKTEWKKHNTRENGDKISMQYLPSTTQCSSPLPSHLSLFSPFLTHSTPFIERFSVDITCRPEKLTRLQEILAQYFRGEFEILLKLDDNVLGKYATHSNNTLASNFIYSFLFQKALLTLARFLGTCNMIFYSDVKSSILHKCVGYSI